MIRRKVSFECENSRVLADENFVVVVNRLWPIQARVEDPRVTLLHGMKTVPPFLWPLCGMPSNLYRPVYSRATDGAGEPNPGGDGACWLCAIC